MNVEQQNERFWLAYDMMQAGNYASARLIFEEIQIFNNDAKCQLAYLCQMGLGGDQDYDQAISLYKAVVDHGRVDAAYDLRLDKTKESIPYFEVASKKGDCSASYWLSEIYSGYNGFQKKNEKSSYFLELAEKQGHLIAKKILLNSQLRNSDSFLMKVKYTIKIFLLKAKIFKVLIKDHESKIVK
jgi:TPR repeat protein